MQHETRLWKQHVALLYLIYHAQSINYIYTRPKPRPQLLLHGWLSIHTYFLFIYLFVLILTTHNHACDRRASVSRREFTTYSSVLRKKKKKKQDVLISRTPLEKSVRRFQLTRLQLWIHMISLKWKILMIFPAVGSRVFIE